MRSRASRTLWVLLSALVLAPNVAAKPRAKDAAPCPAASQVVVRRQATLADALRAALSKRKDLGPADGVAVVIDPTAALKAAKPSILAALTALSALPNRPTIWQVGGLGGPLSAPVIDPSALGPALDGAFLRRGAPVIDTLGALSRTVKRASGRSGVVLYLAHAHFEDAVGLEEFIEGLRSDRRSLCVVGPEAAFERAWEDVVPGLGLWNLGSLPGVGSSPFEPDDPKRPYRGGDTAYPHAPYRWDYFVDWKTAFEPPLDVSALDRAEDPLAEVLRRREVPVPSSYGPYGLMRAAGATGGGYVLWAWAKGDAPVRVYDYGRCDLLPPDLRSRADIAADFDRRPVARALLGAWDALEAHGIVDTTPPWVLGRPAAMRRSVGRDGIYLHGIFETPSERDDAAKSAIEDRGRLDSVLSLISDALAQAGDPKDDVDRRYRADAHLLQQALETLRFRVQEYALWAQAIPKEAWRAGPKKTPRVDDQPWILPEGEGRVAPSSPVEFKDAQGAQRLLASRNEFLERFRGTPYAAIVVGNAVEAFRLDTIDVTLRE